MLRIKIARVRGTSMLPNFSDQDYVVAMNWPYSSLQPGQVVLVLHPVLGLIIKRIFVIDFRYYKLVGDHSSSISPEQMGWVERAQIIGRIICHIPNYLSK
jgi:signal peptidase I